MENYPAGAEFFESSERSGGVNDHEMGFPIDSDGDTGEVFAGDAHGRYETSVHEIELHVAGVVLYLADHGAQGLLIAGENGGNYAGSHAVILKGVGQ